MGTPDTRDKTGFFDSKVRLWGLFLAGGALVAGCTVLGFLGGAWWVLDLFSHFRVQYAVLLALAVGVASAARKLRTAFGFAIFLGLNVAVIVPLYFGGTETGDAVGLRAMHLNVKTDHDNMAQVANAIEHYAADLVLLEEVDERWLSALQPVLVDYPYSVASPRPDNFGIALYSKLPLLDAVTPSFGSAEVPSVQASLVWQGRTLSFLGTHPLPPVNRTYSRLRDEQLHAIALHVLSLPGSVLLMGDLNTTVWSYHFRRLLNVSGLSDCSRGHGVQPTWPADNVVLRVPIDHCLHSSQVTILDKQVGRDVGSDHFPIIVTFAF